MLGRSTLLSEWIREYCSPLVLTVTTTEVENICHKNGLYLHELLRAFGHLDNVNTVIRSSGNPNIPVHDAHIRFERYTEARAKHSAIIEELLKSSFDPSHIETLPSSVSELKASLPSSWNRKIEQIILRSSLSFSEFEMISHPVVILTVVSSHEIDPVISMQDLLSSRHIPACFETGQYENDVHRIYLILHDVAESGHIDANVTLRRLQSKFPAGQCRLLRINSLSQEQMNLQQPDLWSKYRLPMCFPFNLPPVQASNPLPMNPANGEVVLGSRLSIEDFMTLRDFCHSLFNQDIIPILERRINSLNRIVSDARKGVRNVLKSFWRKPREETAPNPSTKTASGTVRYKCDRIESQILQLADLSFIVRDYETAISMYKLVRDDFKADRSNCHLIHTYLMTALSYVLGEQGRNRDVIAHLDAVKEMLQVPTEPPHAIAYFALLATEIYTSKDYRQYIDAAQLLLLSSGHVARYPVLCALLTERAAHYFFIGGYSRRYVLYNILAGYKLRSVGGMPGQHAILNFASSLLLHEGGKWGDIKAKLFRSIAQELNYFAANAREKYYQRALIALLLTLQSVILENDNVGGKESIHEAATVLSELQIFQWQGNKHSNPENSIATVESLSVLENWLNCNVYELLARSLPISLKASSSIAISEESHSTGILEISEFPCPEVNMSSLTIMMSLNGTKSLVPWDGPVPSAETTYTDGMGFISPSAKMFAQAEEMKCMSDIERFWMAEFFKDSMDASANMPVKSLGLRWVETESDLLERRNHYIIRNYQSYSSLSAITSTRGGLLGNNIASIIQIPLGEKVVLRVPFTNRLPIPITLSQLMIDIDLADFELLPVSVTLNPREFKYVFVSIRPLNPGKFTISKLKWNLSETLCVRKNLKKAGPLLHKTQKQRMERLRAIDTSLSFHVISPSPLLTMSFEGVSEEVLQGQLLKTTLLLRNDGAATATEIYLKVSQPCFVFTSIEDGMESSQPQLMDAFGQSCTLVKLPSSVTISSGQTYRLSAWLRLVHVGKQVISLLATYHGGNSSDNSGMESRTSFLSVHTTVVPSVQISVNIQDNPSGGLNKTMFLELANNISVAYTPIYDTVYPNESSPSRRNSSVGQYDISKEFEGLGLDYPSDSHESSTMSSNAVEIMEEGSCQIEGIWVLGCATSDVGTATSWKSFYTLPSEKLVIPLSMNVTKKTCRENVFDRIVNATAPRKNFDSSISSKIPSNGRKYQLQGHSSWPMSLGVSNPRDSMDESKNQTSIVLTQILEKFASISYTWQLFRHDIRYAEYQNRLANLETAIPRTITQVRKDRQKELTNADSFADINMFDEIKLDMDDDDIVDSSASVTANDDQSKMENVSHGTEINDTQSLSINESGLDKTFNTTNGYPSSATDLAHLEASGGNVNVIVVWKCQWQGKPRLGMHNLSHVSVLLNHSVSSSVDFSKRKKTILRSSDYLLAGIYHVPKLDMQSKSESKDSRMTNGLVVPVTVQLRSVNQKPLIISVEVVDRKETKDTASKDGNLENKAPQIKSSSDDSNVAVAKSSSRGFQWICKTKYQDIELRPFASTSLSFHALITQPGVFDLKRFRIDVREPVTTSDQGTVTAIFKAMQGQSLIEVV